jgi:transposase
MLVVETIAKIRRAFFSQGKSIKAICRELRVSRKVARKVIRSGATEFRYEREEQPLPKIGRWRNILDQLLSVNETKAARERLTLIRIFEELRERGYEGGYDAVRRYARRWAKDHGTATAEAYVPLSFAPGEAYQFDWSHEIVLLNGVTVTVKVAHLRLCHSRMLFVRAYPRETQEMVFDAHDRAFALFIRVHSVAVRRSTILGTTCQCSPVNRAPCAMMHHSKTGCCQPPWSGSAANSPASMTAIGRWSTFSLRCSPMG